MATVFPGEKLYELKATHGLPLDVTLSEVIVKHKLRVSWVAFLQAARQDGRWDFQTISDLEAALIDAGVERILTDTILNCCKEWVTAHPHPGVLK